MHCTAGLWPQSVVLFLAFTFMSLFVLSHCYLCPIVSVSVCGCFWHILGEFTCVIFICICPCVAFFTLTPPPCVVLLLLYTRILISLSWCSTPGLSCGQIAALFISLVINITHCTATFAGNNTDNGALALLSLFFPPRSFLLPASLLQREPFLWTTGTQFYLRAIWIFTHFFPNLISSVLNGAIFSCRLQAVTAFQSGSTAATWTLNNNHMLLLLDGSLAPDVTAAADCLSPWCRWTNYYIGIYTACFICWVI